MSDTSSVQLRFDSISKTFPGVRALQDVSFDVSSHSVHALLGENGAGKSTLLKILSGAYRPDQGTILLAGQPRVFNSTAQAIAAGVSVIYQELHLAPELSVAENLFLGHLPSKAGWLDRKTLYQKARQLLDFLGEAVDPQIKVGRLPIAQRQMVEIAKALSRDASVIAFDEPTSSLSSREVDRLFDVIRRLRDQGRAVLYVSHRMDEIYEICGAATVLRDGRHIETFPQIKQVTRDTLVQRMVGRTLGDIFHYTPRAHGPVLLEVKDLNGPGLSAPASFSVKRGEIVGFFGLVGAGRTELMKLLFGATHSTQGSVYLGGAKLRLTGGPTAAIHAGIVFCPEDRKKEGIIPIRSVAENINLSARRHFSRLRIFINSAREKRNAQQQVQSLGVKTPSLSQRVLNLSGGNQQKVILGRWLSEENIQIILLDEPTRGIDVGAKSEIYSIIYQLAQRGVGVVVVSSELPEVLGICDRIIVMRQGKIVAELPREQASQQRLLNLALPVGTEQEQEEPTP